MATKKVVAGRSVPPKKEASSKPKGQSKTVNISTEEQFDKMLEGKMENLPHLPRSVVRIFISSTFSDMHAERNTLATAVIPMLQKFCSGLNLDFQVVDLRWGVTDDSQNDHSVEKICLQEIRNCQRMSLGPNFVAIIGDRYGFRPIPTEMDVKIFELLRSIAKDKDPNGSTLMDVWYKLDVNSQPPQYILQPIRSQFPFFGDYSPGCDEPRAKDTSNWQKTFNELQSVLREAAVTATNIKKLTKEQLHEFFLSVTELEIRDGILKAKDPEPHVAVFQRKIHGFSDLDDAKAKKYVDCKTHGGKSEIDMEVKELQGILEKKIEQVVKKACIHRYNVDWRDGGINITNHQDHKEYMNKFCANFCNILLDQIEKAVKNGHTLIRQSEYYSDYQEILHHLEFCQMKCETFCGREDVLERAKKYIMDASDRKPLVLHAPSGAGKTAVMAMIMKRLPSWFGKTKYVGVIRFLGTSVYSVDIYSVLFGVCGQLADITGIIMEPMGYKNIKSMMVYLPRLLRRVANTLKCPIVILLDSLDQLSKNNDAYSLDWLPNTLPLNVKLILSTLPKEHGILERMQKVLPDKNSYAEIPSLPEKTGREMIDKYLKKKKRSLTTDQQKVLMTAFAKAPGPLFLKLMLDEAAKWNSYTPQHHLVLQESVQGAVSQLFDNLEKKFGTEITGRALGYITICKNGISENELEDVLSCDDEALDDVYRYHNPPVEGIVRIPPVIVARIRYDIREYLVERVSQEKYTMNWYHRQFIETAKTRYATGKDGQILHKNLCEIFMAEDGVRRDITLTNRRLAIPNADRQVTPQPVTASNKRMLTCLPYHVIHAGNELAENIVKEKSLCNFDFVKAKLSVYTVDVFLAELDEYLERNEDEEIQMLKHFLSTSKTDLSVAHKLAVNMLACIPCHNSHPFMKKMLSQAEKFLLTRKDLLLIPVFPCLAPRQDTSSALMDTSEGVLGIVSECDTSVLLQVPGTSKGKDLTDGYKLLTMESCNYEDVPVKIHPNHRPVLDSKGKTIVYDTMDSLSSLTFSNKNILSRKYEEICTKGGSGKLVALTQSSDTSHVVLQFDNGDLSLVEVSGLKPVRTWTLLEEEDDIAGILCTSTDNLKVIVAVGSAIDNSRGKFRIFKAEQDNDTTVNIDKPFTKGMLGLSSSEELIAYVSVSNSSSSIVAMGTENNTIICDLAVVGIVKKLSLAKTKPLAAIMTGSGEVSILNLSSGACLHTFSPKTPVTQMDVSWIYSLAMLGDNQGQIMFYNTENGKCCGDFPAHLTAVKEIRILDDYMLSLGDDKDLRVWSLPELVEGTKQKRPSKSRANTDVELLKQKDIISFDMHPNGLVLVTASQDKMMRFWLVSSAEFQCELNIGISASKILMSSCDKCVALDTVTGEMKLIDILNVRSVSADLPANILNFTLNKCLTIAHTISKKDKLLYISEIDLQSCKVKKTFPLKPGLQFDTLEVSLTDSGRYLIISTNVSPEEYEEIAATWIKQTSSLPQRCPQRFTAVNVQENTGGLLPLYRKVSKVPHVAEAVHALTGNVMAVATRTWALTWDIPTSVCKTWLSRSEVDSKAEPLKIEKTTGQLMAAGLEDGFLFIYKVPVVSAEKRSTKYSVKAMAAGFRVVVSPDNNWVASENKYNQISLWEAHRGVKVFTTRVGYKIKKMIFSSDSQYLVALCGTTTSRMLIFRLHTGDATEKKVTQAK